MPMKVAHVFGCLVPIRKIKLSAALSSMAVLALTLPPPVLAYGGTGWGPLSMVTIYRGSTRTGALLQPSVTFTNGDNCSNPANLFIDFSTTWRDFGAGSWVRGF